MSKKLLSLALVLCMVATLGLTAITASAAIPESPWAALDLDAFKAGTDANWVKANNGVAVETIGDLTGITTTTSATNTRTTNDPAFLEEGATSAPTNKRGWGFLKSRNTITADDTSSYVLTFDHTMGQGSYSMSHAGIYVYLRSSSISNYLDNRFGVMLRRNHLGVPQIGLKAATGSAAAENRWLNITDPTIDFLDCSFRIIDLFETNTIKVYATDVEGTYKFIGSYTLDPATKSVTLVSENGSSLTTTGFGSAISATSSTPIILFNEYPGFMNNLVVSYPYEGPKGVSVDPVPGKYFYDTLELAFNSLDEDAEIYYTVDGSDPIENIDNAYVYFEGDYVDLNPEGYDLPLDVTVKAVELLNGEFSDVSTWVYTLIPTEASYTINYDDALEGTDENFKAERSFVPAKLSDDSASNDALSITSANDWAHITSKFSIPSVAESTSTKFKVKDVKKYGNDLSVRGVYLSFKTDSKDAPTAPNRPYIVFDADSVGVRLSSGWGNTASAVLPFGADLDLSDGNIHDVEFIDYFNGDAYLFIDEQFIAKVEIADGNIILTNGIGQQIIRTPGSTPLVVAKDNIYTNVAVMHDEKVKVGEIEVSYPGSEIPEIPQAVIEAEDSTLYSGFESFDITTTADAGEIYYTLDGTLPTLESESTDGVITIPSSSEEGAINVIVRPYADGVWGIGDTLTYTVINATNSYFYNFDDESYLESWGRNIGAGGTTYFAPTEDGKLTPGINWSMINTTNVIKSGKTNTFAFDIQDVDNDPESTTNEWLPLAVGVRAKTITTWFNEGSSNMNLALFFNGQKLGLRLENGSYNKPEGYSMLDVDADFTEETRVIIKDAVEENLIGVYVQDTEGETEPKLIAYMTLDYDRDETKVYVSLYSVLGGKVENIPYSKARVSAETFQPFFMTLSSANSYTIDNVEIIVNNAVTEEIEIPVSTPVFTELETGSDYYKLISIDANAFGGAEIYYTLDGTTPSKENGTLYSEGELVLIANNGAVLSAIAYDAANGNESEVTVAEYVIEESEYFEYPFNAQAVLDGTDANWKWGSNNNNGRPAYFVNEDGSFTFDRRNSGDYTGAVNQIMTKSSLKASVNGVVITEMDVNGWSLDKRHQTNYIGLRHGNFGNTAMTDNNLFYIKISGSEIAFKDEKWGSATTSYLASGTDFDASGSEYQHITVIDDKINNVVRVLGNNKLLGTFTFSTTTKTNDTVTLTVPTGETATRTYTTTIPTDGQVYLGNAYNALTVKNLITYSGTTLPEYKIVFDCGEFGTTENDIVFVPKYSAIETVPEVTTDFTFEGWSLDGGETVLSAEEVAAIVPTGSMKFVAVYSGISIDNYELLIPTVGTSPVFIDTFKLNGIFEGEFDVYYTLNGDEPTIENATKWDGKYLELTEDAIIKAIAVSGDYATEVATKEITVDANEYWYSKLNNAALIANLKEQASSDGIDFDFTSNRAKDAEGNFYPAIARANDDGSIHVDGYNYGSGTGVSTFYNKHAWNFYADSNKTAVYSFDLRNAQELDAANPYRSIYFGIRVPKDPGYVALVNNKNPQITIANNRIGLKFGGWGAAASVIWAKNVPENFPDITANEWVNITIVDDRVNNIISVFADGILLANYSIDGANFTMTDIAGVSTTVTYDSDIISNGYAYLGSAYYTFDFDNLVYTTGTNVPELNVTFNVGENGTTSDETAYTYTKYDMITEVPEVTANPYYTFNGWKLNDKLYTDLDIIKIMVTGDCEFVADYTYNPLTLKVELGSVDAEKGRTVKVPFSVTSEVEVAGYVTFAYDAEVLTFNEAASSENIIDNGDGTITVNVEGLTVSETIAFTFASEIGAETVLQVCDYDLAAVNEEPIAVTVVDGTVTCGVLKGDANQNGKIDIYDAVSVLKHIAEIEVFEGEALTAADVTADGEITIDDATQILKYIARMIETF